MNKLPPCFAFKNTGKHPRKDEIKKRFNELDTPFKWGIHNTEDYYGRVDDCVFFVHNDIKDFGESVVEITEDDFLDMTEPELTELPKVFAFKNNPNSPNHDLLRGRFDGFFGTNGLFLSSNNYYGRTDAGDVGCCPSLQNFGKDVVEITEQQFLDLTEPKPELTKLPDNFYFQYVDEKDREVLKERFRYNYIFSNIGSYYGKNANLDFCRGDKDTVPENSIEITQADFIRLTEPEIVTEHLPKPDFPYKGDIKDFPKEVVEWMLDNQVKQGNKRDISVFEVCRWCNRVNGGFDFDDATEGGDFWQTIFGVT